MRWLSALVLIFVASCAIAPAYAGDYQAQRDQTVRLDVVTPKGAGWGSGVIVSSYQILTAKHVVDDSGGTVALTFANGETRRGTVLWVNADLDVAIVGTAVPESLKPARIDCDPVAWGEPVIATGFPLRTMWSIVHGYVASVDQLDVDVDDPSVVLDLTVLAGISGGPVFNASGRVVGFVDAVMTFNRAATGLGLMIPASRFCAVLPAGIVQTAYLDAFGDPVDFSKYIQG